LTVRVRFGYGRRAMHDAPAFPFLREILLFLVLAGVLIPLLQRLRVNQIVGFLAAGVALGPFGLGLWAERWPWLGHLSFPKLEGVAVLAELGVLFLMFMIGLELSAERLWSLRRWVFGAGTAQLLASAAAIGGLAWAFGNPWPVAAVLGAVLALSSTAVAMQLLSERQALGTPLGRACFSVLMLQDLAVVPLLVVVGALAAVQRATGPETDILSGLGEVGGLVAVSLVKAAVAVVAIAWVGRRVVRPLFRTLARGRQPDVFMALTLLATLSIAGLTAAAGLSMALGALLAGLLLSETEFRHEVEVTIEPFRGLLMGLFFMSVGMGIDLREVAAAPLLVPASVLGLFAIKAAVLWAVLRTGGLPAGRALEGGLLLGQGGEFAFIVVGVATVQGLLSAQVGQFMLLVVGLSLVATPLAARFGRELGDRIDRGSGMPAQSVESPGDAFESARGHVVIAGFGRVGESIGRLLDARGVRWAALETDATRVTERRAHGAPVWYGNATRVELLRRLRVGDAAAVVLTMDQPASALHALRAIRREYPTVPIVARSRDEAHAAVLRDEGATVVIPETLEAGLQIAAVVLQAAGTPEPAAAALVDAERERRIGALRG
jgi:CPA2 family monovalent cation:H+ antiporter-2